MLVDVKRKQTMTRAIILLVFLPGIFGFLSRKFLLCNQSSISPLFLDSSSQNLSISLCNRTFDLVIQTNENFFSPNISIDKSIKFQTKRRFAYIGSLENDDESIVSLIRYPNLQIFIYYNRTYYYYLSLDNRSANILRFSQKQLLQLYSQLVNDSLWTNLRQEEEIYQKNSLILYKLHFVYELLTLRCETNENEDKTRSFCSLALMLDRMLYENAFSSNIYHLYTIIEHFNFLLRTLTHQEYGGFLLKRLTLINHVELNSNSSYERLHNISKTKAYSSKDYCLVHEMLSTDQEKDTSILGYQSSIHTYDIGGVCSSPFYINNNQSEEVYLNTGLSILNENLTQDHSIFFNVLMKTSYLFLRQMGLNLTLCSVNSTRRRFFQFNSNISPIVQDCIDLLPKTLPISLKRRAHLCFTHLNLYNSSLKPVKQDIFCKQSLDLQSSVPITSKHRKSPYIDNALNNNRHAQWMEGNIVGIILTFSLIIWIPVSCFVHFCVDEINKKSLLEKQQQEMENLSVKLTTNGVTKQTQTD